jgi:predicted Zn finger-like uncharacterized protein
MLITCPSCSTAYGVELSSLGESGRQVRCARCRTTWLATAESAVPAHAEADTRGGDDAPADGPARGDAEDFGMSEWAAALEEDRLPARVSGPVAVVNSPSLVPEQAGAKPAAEAHTIEAAGEDIETIASRRARVRRKGGARWTPNIRRPGLPSVIVILCMVLGGVIQWRSAVVRVFPQTGSLFRSIGLSVNLRGMTFENLKTSQEFQDGVTVLVVEGTIVNQTRNAVEVPRLRFALRNGMGQEIYSWTALPQRSTLAAEETVAFRTRLASPPGEGRDVVVRFFTRHDLASGQH